MTVAALRCASCGKERLVRPLEKGATVACDGCGGTIDVPENLAFQRYWHVFGDREIADTMTRWLWMSFLFPCLPAAALCWWILSGAIQRARDEGRPVEPTLRRARLAAIGVTCFLACAYLAVTIMVLRR